MKIFLVLLKAVLDMCLLQPTQPADLNIDAWGRLGGFKSASFVAVPASGLLLNAGFGRRPALAQSKTGCFGPKQPVGLPQSQRRAALLVRATNAPNTEDGEEENAAGYPERTLAAVRKELLLRRLDCPFPFSGHARDDFFEALLERLLIDGIWPDRYDKRDRNKAKKQARLDAAMWAVQNSEKMQLSRDQIQSIAKAERVADHDARRIAAALHNLRLTVVQVLPRTTESFGVDWSVNSVTYQNSVDEKPDDDADDSPDTGTDSEVNTDSAQSRTPVDVCLVYSAGKYWSTAPLVSLRRSLDDDWMPKSFTQPQTTPAPSAVLLPLPPPPVAFNLPLFGAQERASDLQGAESGNITTARMKTTKT